MAGEKFDIMELSTEWMRQRVVRHNWQQILLGTVALLGGWLATAASVAFFYLLLPVLLQWAGMGLSGGFRWGASMLGTGLLYWLGFKRLQEKRERDDLAHSANATMWQEPELPLLQNFGLDFYWERWAALALFEIFLAAPLLLRAAGSRFQRRVELSERKPQHLVDLMLEIGSKRKWQPEDGYAPRQALLQDLIDMSLVDHSPRKALVKPSAELLEEMDEGAAPLFPNFTTTDLGNLRNGNGGRL